MRQIALSNKPLRGIHRRLRALEHWASTFRDEFYPQSERMERYTHWKIPEMEKLDTAITETNQILKDLLQQQLRAARTMWAERLDKAAQEYAAIAAHLHATEKALGRSSSLVDVYVPLQAPLGPMSINENTITEKARAISIEQLIAA